MIAAAALRRADTEQPELPPGEEQHEERVTLLAASGGDGSGAEKSAADPSPAAAGAEPEGVEPGAGLRKALNVCDGVAIVIGVIIGGGIFASPGPFLFPYHRSATSLYRIPVSPSSCCNAISKIDLVLLLRERPRAGVVMDSSGSVWWGLLAWAIAGCLAAASSLVYCELGAMIPQVRRQQDRARHHSTQSGASCCDHAGHRRDAPANLKSTGLAQNFQVGPAF
jgi:hypothetical protein